MNPRSADEAWVVNQLSDSVSVVSVSRLLVTDTIPVQDHPADVVFGAGRAFVSVAGKNEIWVFDVETRALEKIIPVAGGSPRALVAHPNTGKVYAAFFLAGNGTTLLPEDRAPPQPIFPHIPDRPPQVGLIIEHDDPAWKSEIPYRMPDHDVVEIDAKTLVVNRYFSRAGTINMALALHPTRPWLYVANTEARNVVRFEPNLRGRFLENRLSKIDLATEAVTPFVLDPDAALPDGTARELALAQPAALAFDAGANGLRIYLAAFGSDKIAVLSESGLVLSRIDLTPGSNASPPQKRGPRGLALHPSANCLYVLNRISNTISIIDTAKRQVIAEFPVGQFDPTPARIRNGRGFLYDAKLSQRGTVSCASCHVDADFDHLAWDLGDPEGQVEEVRTSAFTHRMHPLKGPMVTQTLRGLAGVVLMHWRGDRHDFLSFNPSFQKLLGGRMLEPEEMLALRDFIDTIVFPPNPNLQLDGTLPAALADGDPQAGRTAFAAGSSSVMSCKDCHKAEPGSGGSHEILPASFIMESQPFRIVHLRNLYQKQLFNAAPGAMTIAGFGFGHDGATGSLPEFLARHDFQAALTNET
ncbi:MAG: YncE family protein, partial [Verrucomicrobiota bacterium]